MATTNGRIDRPRSRWPTVAAGAGVVLFLAWLVTYVVALASIATDCGVETGFDAGYELIDRVFRAWPTLLIAQGVTYLAIAAGAFVTRRQDAPSRRVLVAVGLLPVLGTIVMDLLIVELVLQSQPSRTSTTCDV